MAKAVGVYRPGSIAADQVRKLKAEGLGATDIVKTLKIGHACVYRVCIAGAGTGAGDEGSAVPRRER